MDNVAVGSNTRHLVGVVSDTHGIARPALLAALKDCELIVHAGDVGRLEVLHALQRVAPLVAVRGNMDRGPLARQLRRVEAVEVGQVRIYLIHDVEEMDIDPAAAGFHAVVSGHSHMASLEQRKGVLFVNPGSAGPQRSSRPASAALLHVEDGALHVEFVELRG